MINLVMGVLFLLVVVEIVGVLFLLVVDEVVGRLLPFLREQWLRLRHTRCHEPKHVCKVLEFRRTR